MENQEKTPESIQSPEEPVVLSPKRERFCQEYIKSHNATEAAKAAGYSKRSATSQGPRLMENAEVRSRIAQLERPIAKKLAIDTEWVVRRSKEVVERCMQAVPVITKNEKGELVESGEYQFDSRGANGALALLAKHVGGFTDHLEHVIKKSKPDEYTDKQKAAMADALDKLDSNTSIGSTDA
jgi:phage terminase small subunit